MKENASWVLRFGEFDLISVYVVGFGVEIF